MSFPQIFSPTFQTNFPKLSSKITKSAIQSSLSYFIQISVELISLISLSWLPHNSLQLSALGLATMMVNVIALAPGIGLTGGIETLCSQANGDRQYKLVSIYYQAGLLVLMALLVPVVMVLVCADGLLMALDQERVVVMMCQEFINGALPGVVAAYLFEGTKKLVYARQRFWDVLVVNVVTTPLHVLWVYLLVFRWDMGVGGCGVALSVTYWLDFGLLLVVCRLRGSLEGVWFGWELREALSHCKQVLIYGVPAGLVAWFNWSACELFTLQVGVLSHERGDISMMAAHVALMNTIFALYAIGLGFGVAGTSIAGNYIGAKEYRLAKFTNKIALGWSFLCISIVNIILYSQSERYSHLFSDSPKVQQWIQALVPFMFLFSIFDTLQNVTVGIVKATGYQSQAAKVTFISSYFLAQPLGYFFAIHLDLGIKVIWTALTCGVGLSFVVLQYKLARRDWSTTAIAQRIEFSSFHDEDPELELETVGRSGEDETENIGRRKSTSESIELITNAM